MTEFSSGDRLRFPDFTGTWLCIRQDGMNNFLDKLGVGFVMKNLAWTMNYGVNKLKQDVEQEGKEAIKVTVHGPRGAPKTMKVPLDGSKFTLTTERGDVQATACWSSDGHAIESIIGEESDAFTGKRFMNDHGEMVIVQTKKGVSATRYFVRV